MSEWTAVTKKPPPAQGQRKTKQQQSAKDIRVFLETFKTVKCTEDAWHDWFTCPCYHNVKDKRRDPYCEPYDPADAINKVEVAYHPRNFRTRLCHRRASTGKCDFGNVCAFAHCEGELRSGDDYDVAPAAPPPPKLGDFGVKVSSSPTAAASVPPVVCGWEEGQQKPGITTELISLTERQHFGVARSRTLWSQLRDVARGHLCELERFAGHAGDVSSLRLVGVNAKDAVPKLREALEGAVLRGMLTEERPYPARVLEIIKRRITADGPRALVSARSAFLEVDLSQARATLAVTVVRESPLSAQILAGAFERVDFFVREARYDEFATCEACFEELNLDQLARCPNGHSFCCEGADGGCFDLMLREQRERLRAQDSRLLCPMCKDPISMQTVAASVSKESWDVLERDIVDSKVSAATARLESEFDDRLRKKVDELMRTYASDGEGRLKLDAQAGAARARDEALNLRCPHCSSVYAEFDGCMALQCSTCREHFCAYCHKKCESGRGAHMHVRECDMNLTPNGSYYASAEQIEDGQRRYRTKTLKKFLRMNFKKHVQNAIIIELASDLQDLKIDPNALYDFGVLAEV